MKHYLRTWGYGVYDNGDGGNNPPPPPPPAPPKTFTQDELNKILADDRRKHQQKLTELTSKLGELELTAQAKTELERQLEEMSNQYLTKEQQLERERLRIETESKKQLETLTGERDSWQSRYRNALVNQKITEAAVANKALSTEQMLGLLAGNAKIVQKKDSDDFDVMIKFNDVDVKTKQPVTLELTAAEVVKRMTELPERYGNLFQTTATGGLGTTGGTSGSTRGNGELDWNSASDADVRAYLKANRKGF